MRKKGFVFLETIIILMLVTVALTTMLASYTLVTTKSYEKQYYDRISDKYLLYAISNLGTTQKDNYQKLADLLVKNAGSGDSGEKLGILKINAKKKDCEIMCQSLYTKKCYCELSNCAGKTGQQKTECVNTCLNSGGIKNLESTKVYCSIMGLTNASCTLNGSNPVAKTEYKGVNHNTSSFDRVVTDVGNCTVVFEQMQLDKLYIVKDIAYALRQDEATKFIDNGTIEYMKSLKKCHTKDVYVEYEKVVSTCEDSENNKCKVRRVVKQGLHDDSDPNFKCEEPIQYMIGVFYRNEDYYYASIEL